MRRLTWDRWQAPRPGDFNRGRDPFAPSGTALRVFPQTQAGSGLARELPCTPEFTTAAAVLLCGAMTAQAAVSDPARQRGLRDAGAHVAGARS